MSKTLVSNEWGLIVKQGEILELRWLPSSTEMTDAGFMATLCLLAWTAEETRPDAILIDAVEFRHKLGPEMAAWRDAHIIPHYGAAGVRRFAFLMPSGFPEDGKESIEGPAVFPTRWYVHRDDAIRWLQGGQ